jgi:acyl CoA:acetate/3-ketoacid CoA transferase beta subunit
MKVKFVEHSKERMMVRCASEAEIQKVLLLGTNIPAKKGRKAKEMTFEYGEYWLGKVYPQKKVVVIYYIEENDEIVVITVKVFYGQWR